MFILKTTWNKLTKWIAMAVLGVGVTGLVVGGAPLSEREMKWKGFEQYAFNTPTGELGVDEYAVDDTGLVYFIRASEDAPIIHKVGEEGERPIPPDMFKRKLVEISGKACYNRFTNKDGEYVYEQTPCDEYRKHATVRNNPQPVKTERISMFEAIAAVAYDNVTTDQDTGAVTSSSFSHTTSGSDRALFVGAGQDDAGNDTASCTYNGVSMNLVAEMESAIVAGSQYISVFGLANPASGSNTVACSWSTPNESIIIAQSVTGADQTTPNDTAVTSGGTGGAVSDNVTTSSGDMILDFMNINGTDAANPGGTQTSRADVVNGPSGQRHAASSNTGSGSVAMAWSGWVSQRRGHIAFNVRQAVAAVADPGTASTILFDNNSTTVFEPNSGATTIIK